MLDIDRRNLLKGILASTAVLAAPAALMAEPGPIEMLPDVTPIIEPGEIFIRSRGLWRFAGRWSTLDMKREVDEVMMYQVEGDREFRGIQSWEVNVNFSRLLSPMDRFSLDRINELDAVALGVRDGGTAIVEGRLIEWIVHTKMVLGYGWSNEIESVQLLIDAHRRAFINPVR